MIVMSRLRTALWRAVAALVLAASWAMSDGPVRAEEVTAPVFAIIDMQRVLRESVAVKSLTQEIEAQRDTYQSEIREKEDALRAADKELVRQRTILAPDVLAQKRRELEEKVAALQREVNQRKRALDQRFGRGMGQVRKELAAVAKEIAEEYNLDMIMSKAAVVIMKPKFDMTTAALERLNARLPKISTAN